MSFHLIIPIERTTWGMSPEIFAAKIKEQWPDTSIEPGQVPGIALNWSISFEDFNLHGTFHDDGLAVGLNGFFNGFALFACWYRKLVPMEVPLVLIDEGLETMYPLGAETTPDDIISGRIATTPPPGKP